MPKSADRGICMFCGKPVGGLAAFSPGPKTSSGTPKQKPKMGKLIQTLIFLAIFAGTIGYDYYKKYTLRQKKGEVKTYELNTPNTGAHFKIMEEYYYDKHNKYSDDFEALNKQVGKVSIDPEITFAFSAVSETGFTLYTTHPSYPKGKKHYYYNLPKLHRAARSGDVRWINEQLDNGQDVNQLDQFGHTAIYHAQKHKQKEAQNTLALRGGIIK